MNGDITPADPTANAILDAVEHERSRLINVVAVVRCMKFSEEAAGEVLGALALVEEELERILGALEAPQLLKGTKGGAEGEQ